MSTITIRKTSITALDTDAVVNAANEGLWAGGGVCGAIFKAAGHDELQAACRKIGHCDTGSAVITPGFGLKAKYIIHAVGPRWTDGKHREPELLYGAYYRSLELAAAHNCRSVGFPLISSGIFGYPAEGAWKQALAACRDFLDQHKEVSMDILFAVLSDEVLEIGKKALEEISAQGNKTAGDKTTAGGGPGDRSKNWAGDRSGARTKAATRKDWKNLPMPERCETFVFRRPFTEEQLAALRRGHIPQGMEDKWFWYVEDDTLYAHRSWSGFCIYRIDLRTDGRHVVTVNRDPEQYGETDIAEDARQLSRLLNRWVEDTYDYYNEWLAETWDALKKAGKDSGEE